MVRSTRRRLTLALDLSMTAIIVLLAANFALAQQAERQSAPASSAPEPIQSADEAYRKGSEFQKKQDYAEALRWYRMAADRGNAQAQVGVGNLYAQGQGVPQDYSEALRWFRMAADQGNSEAQNDVGLFYLSGLGVSQDYPEGLRWLHKAADQGNEVAQRNIGMAYLLGMGVPPNRTEAIRWLRKAADKGDEDAKTALKSLGAQ